MTQENENLTHSIYHLWQETGKNQALSKMIVNMIKQPPPEPSVQRVFEDKFSLQYEQSEREIMADLTANHFQPNENLVHSIYHLWQETEKKLTLCEIATMIKRPPLEPEAQDLLKYIQYEFSKQPAFQNLKEKASQEERQECLAEMKKFGYELIEWTEPIENSYAKISFQHQDTGDVLRYDLRYDVIEQIEKFKIAEDLVANNFKPTAELVSSIHNLCVELRENLTLREIADMAKEPASDPYIQDLLDEIKAECCKQELAFQAINELAAELV